MVGACPGYGGDSRGPRRSQVIGWNLVRNVGFSTYVKHDKIAILFTYRIWVSYESHQVLCN